MILIVTHVLHRITVCAYAIHICARSLTFALHEVTAVKKIALFQLKLTYRYYGQRITIRVKPPTLREVFLSDRVTIAVVLSTSSEACIVQHARFEIDPLVH